MTRRKFIKILLGTVCIIPGLIPSVEEPHILMTKSDGLIMGFDLAKGKDRFEVYYFNPADFGGPGERTEAS